LICLPYYTQLWNKSLMMSCCQYLNIIDNYLDLPVRFFDLHFLT
jgi:hypothetical protein